MIRSPDGKKTFRTDSFELNETTEEEWCDYDSLDLDEDHPAPLITPRLIKDFVVARCK